MVSQEILWRTYMLVNDFWIRYALIYGLMYYHSYHNLYNYILFIFITINHTFVRTGTKLRIAKPQEVVYLL
jgi:hypothetical protein